MLGLKRGGRTIIFSTHQMEVAEKICDDICLLNRAEKILDGSLRQIKEGFGRNAVALRVEGSNGVLNDKSLVAHVETHSDELEVILRPEVDPQHLLRKLVDSGVKVSKFEMIEPSLHDIFIQKVTEAE